MTSRIAELEARIRVLQVVAAKRDEELRELLLTHDSAAAAWKDDPDLLAEIVKALKLNSEQEDDFEVKTEVLLWFLVDAVRELRGEEFPKNLSEKLADLPLAGPAQEDGDGSVQKTTKERYARIRQSLDELYTDIWAKYGVESEAASKAMGECDERLTRLNEAEAMELRNLVICFQDAEEELEGVLMLGREAWKKRKAKQDRFNDIRQEIVQNLTTLKGADAQAYAMKIQQEGMELQKKLRSMPNEEAAEFLDNATGEDGDTMLKFQAFNQIMNQTQGDGGHGHSHGGKTCHGHGHSQENEHNHSHSHQQAHGHSHDGKPCHGHGH